MSNQKAMFKSAISPSYKSVLDLGCGTGEFCTVVSSKVYHGVDTDALGIDQAKELHPGYSFAPMKTVADVKGTYDLIALIDTVHHLSPEIFKATLNEATKRLLKKGGKLLILDAVHPTEQRKWIGDFIFSHDRGNFQRTKSQVMNEISGKFEVVRYEIFQEKVLTFYLLLAKPKASKK
jgi:cyclopropane fatty-acyl-phospholipid synthase-like methyltransferase